MAQSDGNSITDGRTRPSVRNQKKADRQTKQTNTQKTWGNTSEGIEISIRFIYIQWQKFALEFIKRPMAI
jgi:hypothetical protein